MKHAKRNMVILLILAVGFGFGSVILLPKGFVNKSVIAAFLGVLYGCFGMAACYYYLVYKGKIIVNKKGE